MLLPIYLNKIYNVYIQKIEEQLKTAPEYLSMTCDMWSDRHKHRSCICFTIHLIDSIFRSHKYSLKQNHSTAHTQVKRSNSMSPTWQTNTLSIDFILFLVSLRVFDDRLFCSTCVSLFRSVCLPFVLAWKDNMISTTCFARSSSFSFSSSSVC